MVDLTRDVIAAAQAAERKWEVFTSVSLAQFGLESGWGAKATGAFNFFGIKAAAGQPGLECHTHEEIGGVLVPKLCRFRTFASVADAFDEHARLIATDRRYAAAMAQKSNLQGFVRAMAAVYATDRRYAGKLLELIQEDGLEHYDVLSAPAAPMRAAAGQGVAAKPTPNATAPARSGASPQLPQTVVRNL